MAGDLRDELLDLDVESVEGPAGGPPPPLSKSAEVFTIGALVLTLGPSVVEGVVAVLVSWLSRQPSDVAIEIDGQSFSGTVTRKQREALVATYLARVSQPAPAAPAQRAVPAESDDQRA
jgi:hypothetical protein